MEDTKPLIKRVWNNRQGRFVWAAIPVQTEKGFRLIRTPYEQMFRAMQFCRKLNKGC